MNNNTAKTYKPHISSIGNVAANLIAALACVSCIFIGPVACVIVLFIEKRSGLVRWYLAQSIIISLGYSIVKALIKSITGTSIFSIGGIFSLLRGISSVMGSLLLAAVALLQLLLLVVCAINAYRWVLYRIPLISKAADWIIDNIGEQAAYNGEDTVPQDCQPGGMASAPQLPTGAPYNGPGSVQHQGAEVPPVVPYGSQPTAPQQPGAPVSPHGAPPVNNAPAPGAQSYAPSAPLQPYSDPNDQIPPDMRDPK